MKKLLFPFALFAAISFTACDKETLEEECNIVEQSDLPEDTESCKISEHVNDIGYCSDEESEDVHFTYKGEGNYDENTLISVVCPDAVAIDKKNMATQLSAKSKSLLIRLRARAL